MPAFTISASAQESASAAPKDFTVFVGLSAAVIRPEGLGHVRKVAAGIATVVVNGDSHDVSLRTPLEYELTREPTLSKVRVALANERGEPTYSAARNPNRNATQTHMLMNSLAPDLSAVARAESALVEATTRMNDPIPANSPAAAVMQERQAALEDARNNSAYLSQMGNYDANFGSVDNGSGKQYDAFEITLDLSAPSPLENAYVLVVTHIRLPPQGDAAMLVKLHDLPRLIDARPRRVKMLQTGMPVGFAADRFEVHIYAAGKEVATNRSDSRLELTLAEAFHFRLLQHQIAHRGASVPPAVANEFVPATFAGHVPANQRQRTVDVHVNKDGRATIIAFDTNGTPEVDAFLRTEIPQLLFFPALVNGAPVETNTTLVLDEFLP